MTIRIINISPHLNNINRIYGNKFLLKQTNFDNIKYNYLCWKSRCLYNIYFDEYSDNKKIFALDFNISKDILKIKHLSINNDYYDKIDNKNKNKLNDEELMQVKFFVFDLIKNKAIEKNINKVVIDIHSNLERYNYDLKNEGFIPNFDIKSNDNPLWIQAEKTII
jgi:hypothetical protein